MIEVFNLNDSPVRKTDRLGQNQIGGQKVKADQREIYPDKLDPGNVLIHENGETQ